MHTGAGRYRSGRFAIPCGGPGSGRVSKGWDVSATPNGTLCLCSWHCSWRGLHHVWRSVAKHAAQLGSTTCGSRRSRCGVKGHCGVAASKVGQARRLSALTVAPVAPVVIAKKRAEVAKARPGENAPQAIITCIEAAMRSSSYANGVMVEQRAKFQGLTAKLGPLDVADIVGAGLMGGGTREGHGCHRQDLCSQRGAKVQVSKWWWVGHIASVCLHKCADRHRTVSLSKLKLSLVGHTWSSILSSRNFDCMSTAILESTVREGLMHLVVFG